MTEEKMHENEHGSIVPITVDGKEVSIHRGHQAVQEIKQVGHVSPGYDLDQIVNGKIIPLSDDEHITIKGNEVFVSHPKDGSSS